MTPRRQVPPRERAARILCQMDGLPPSARMEGRPLWESYLPEVDAVLGAVLGAEEVERVVDAQSLSKGEGKWRQSAASTTRTKT